MGRMRISSWMAASLFVVGCGGESRTLAENESCLGPAPASGGAVANTELDMPDAEADLEAWVIREQGGMLQVTTRPCDPQPSAKLLLVLPEARVVARNGDSLSFRDIEPGMKVSVWYAGGAKGKARAVVVDRVEPWPPGSGPTPTPAATPEAEATPEVEPTAAS